MTIGQKGGGAPSTVQEKQSVIKPNLQGPFRLFISTCCEGRRWYEQNSDKRGKVSFQISTTASSSFLPRSSICRASWTPPPRPPRYGPASSLSNRQRPPPAWCPCSPTDRTGFAILPLGNPIVFFFLILLSVHFIVRFQSRLIPRPLCVVVGGESAHNEVVLDGVRKLCQL